MPEAPIPDRREQLAVAVETLCVALASYIRHLPEILPHEPDLGARRGDHLLTHEEVADQMGLTVDEVKRRPLPFRVKLGHRTVGYSAKGLEKFLTTSRETP